MGRGQDLYAKAKRLIPGGTQLLSKRPEMFLPDQWPAYYSRARGVAVWDLDGRRFVDMSINAAGACPLGYSDPDVNAAVISAVEAGSTTTLNPPEEVALAELMCDLHPWAQMCRFARAGGEAMAIAVRIARARTDRSLVAICGYHGWADWYLAANRGGRDALGAPGLLLPGLDPAGVPAELMGTTLTFPHNDLDELREITAARPGELAAIVCEPQRSLAPTSEFLSGLREIADAEDAVLIFDEITAALRLNLGGVHLLHEITPDIAVFAKAIGNGFPIACVLGTADAMEAAQNTFISSTSWSERVGPAAALATLEKHRSTRACERLVDAGRRVQSIWNREAAEVGLEVDVGPADMPPLSSLGFIHPEGQAVRTLFCQCMLDRGYLDNGHFYATVEHTPAVLDEYRGQVRSAFEQVAAAVDGGTVETSLRGPVAHTGFARLTV
jgi:glutamate-1-semialdehyde 2,1-aminomutase